MSLTIYKSYLPGAENPPRWPEAEEHVGKCRDVCCIHGSLTLIRRLNDLMKCQTGHECKPSSIDHIQRQMLIWTLPSSCMTRVWWEIEWDGGEQGRWSAIAGALNETYGFAIVHPHKCDPILYTSPNVNTMETLFSPMRVSP